MKTKSKTSGHVVRSAAYAALLSCVIIGFSSAFNVPGSGRVCRGSSSGAQRGEVEGTRSLLIRFITGFLDFARMTATVIRRQRKGATR